MISLSCFYTRQGIGYSLETELILPNQGMINCIKNSEYDQEIPQSQTADNPSAREEEPLNHHETSGRQIKQSNQLSLPHQDDCNTRMDIK